jgi:ABC-type glycerol-3-phosphate transport system substrate-binding protein
MPRPRLFALAALAALAACGGDQEAAAPEEREPVETVFDDMIGTQDKAQQRLDAAREGHRDALEQQLSESEGSPAADE